MSDETFTLGAEIIARRLGFQIDAVKRALRAIGPDPLKAYLEIATLPELEAWDRLWKAICSEKGKES